MSSPMAFEGAVILENQCLASLSPYVRSHSSNATAWQLWSPATIELARKSNRLMFVSIGYSACHWCHVMSDESFSDPRIAQLLNGDFIPVKIDREERPDIDRQYMDFIQATNGGGGWPLNVFVTPDLEPIFGGTYWPGPNSKTPLIGSASFEQILLKVASTWKEQEARCRENGRQTIQQLREFAKEGTLRDGRLKDGEEDGLEPDVLDDAFQHYRHRYDAQFGGFGGAPKFPTPVHIRPLLRVSCYPKEVREIVGEEECIESQAMAVKTLESMAKGGIKDQIGHGFARYSVTRDWSLPHFEKMLYDNAQLLPVYLDAFLVTGLDLFRETVHDIAQYLTTPPVASPLGAFHSSEDADSLPTALDKHKREGAYYVWKLEDFVSVLGPEQAEICAKYWNVKAEGNVDARYDVQGELTGQNTLSVQHSFAELAKESGKTEDEVKSAIREGRQKLAAYREEQRPRPSLDDKVVTAWNGLAVGGLARSGAALQSRDYVAAAVKAVEFIRDRLYDAETHTLRRVYREEPGNTPGFADDYAFFISGLLDLYEATFDDSWLEFAETLQQTQIRLFWDEEKHGFFSTPFNQADILVRTKDAMDNAEPSVNSTSAANLFRLSSLLSDTQYERMAKQTVACFEVEIGQHPGLFSGMLSSVVASKTGMRGMVIVGEGDIIEAALQKARESVRPNYTILRVGGSVKSEWIRKRNNLLKDVDGSKAMVQLCEAGACRILETKDIPGLFVS